MAYGGHEIIFHHDEDLDVSGFTDDHVYDQFQAMKGDDMGRPSIGHEIQGAETKLKLNKVDAFYKSISQVPHFIDPNDFELSRDGTLYIKVDKRLDRDNRLPEKIQLTYKNNPDKFLALSTLKQKLGAAGLRDQLRIDTLPPLKSAAVKALQSAEIIAASGTVEEVPLQDLSKISNEIDTAVKEVIETEVDITSINDPPLPMREILGLNQALQSIKGEMVNNLAKLSELDKSIEYEKEKLAYADDHNYEIEFKEKVQQRLHDLYVERSARIEVLETNREDMRGQFSRIRETIHKMLNEDTTLGERLRTLFREQGITIASIITALGMVISTVVLAVSPTTGGPGGQSPSGPDTPVTPDKPSGPAAKVKEWIKQQLRNLADLLMSLASKAAAAIPGIIGSLVSWLLSSAGKVAGYMADHMWTLIVFIGATLVGYIQQKIRR